MTFIRKIAFAALAITLALTVIGAAYAQAGGAVGRAGQLLGPAVTSTLNQHGNGSSVLNQSGLGDMDLSLEPSFGEVPTYEVETGSEVEVRPAPVTAEPVRSAVPVQATPPTCYYLDQYGNRYERTCR